MEQELFSVKSNINLKSTNGVVSSNIVVIRFFTYKIYCDFDHINSLVFIREKNIQSKIKNKVFLVENLVLIGFSKVIGVKIQLPISFGIILVFNKISKVKGYECLNSNILLHIKSDIK